MGTVERRKGPVKVLFFHGISGRLIGLAMEHENEGTDKSAKSGCNHTGL